jgi:hypothetical protein
LEFFDKNEDAFNVRENVPHVFIKVVLSLLSFSNIILEHFLDVLRSLLWTFADLLLSLGLNLLFIVLLNLLPAAVERVSAGFDELGLFQAQRVKNVGLYIYCRIWLGIGKVLDALLSLLAPVFAENY